MGTEAKHMYINGEWVPADSKKTYDLIDPSNGEVIAKIANGGVNEAKRAIDAASAAFPLWAATPPKERGEILKRAEYNLIERADEIATLLSKENGKPFT